MYLMNLRPCKGNMKCKRHSSRSLSKCMVEIHPEEKEGEHQRMLVLQVVGH